MKKKNSDSEFMRNNIQEIIQKRYKPTLSSRAMDVFEDIATFILICLWIIFRPLNLLVIGSIICVIIFMVLII